MRVEDLDGPRVKAEASREAIDILAWLGIDFDGEPLVQSNDLEPYRNAMRQLSTQRLIYACDLTRTQIEAAASAPHTGEHELRYPPEMRPTLSDGNIDPMQQDFETETRNYRLIVPDEEFVIHDHIAGRVTLNPFNEIGDFVVWTKRGVPAYQLAVVVDDARQGVTDVVRGDDLLPSAARQMLLYRAMGFDPPRWWHLPLVLGTDGRRLAKRHGDTRLSGYRNAGVAAERVLALLARWSGVDMRPRETELSARDFRDRFDVNRLSRLPVVFTEEDHRWLLRK